MWVAECSNANERGRLVLTQGIFATIGTVAAAWLEFGLLFTTSAANWRFPIAFQGVYILIVTSLVLFLPESPRWLITKDQPEQASSVLSALQGLPISSPTITQEIAQMRASYREEQHQQSTSALFNTSPERPFHRATLAILVAIFGQMCGLNIVTFYSDTILETQLHYSASETRIFSGCMQIWQMLSACLSVLVIDRFGRRKLLLCGAVGMCITQAALAGLMSDLSTSPAAAKAAIFLYFCAMFFFPIGLFLIPFMYAAEIAPLAIRHQVTAIAACANWLFNFLVAEVTPHAMENIGYRYYIVYACINAFAVVVVGFFCPETRGRSLEEMDEVFVRSRGLLDPVRLEKGMPRRAEGEGIGGGDVEKELDVRLEGGS
ncbi:MFS general substrate transporter [Aspergillus ellipticus CBS 707.79]|uniref:MFS general substrate transporter n=1 Tax=Aspergillus ellipticus CBS 707.79 TaxID=1448320 RepID=A0A319DGU6_9EURO|nr:MFS general substrate transporter [Aspergillus ellipticus CBS 707.79]